MQFWNDMQLYTALRQKAHGKAKYILHDGPPYANGRIHEGHVLNKILKDLVVKTKQMEGFDAVYVPGWDCHGLPIEHQVALELGSARATMSKAEIRRRCHAYAERFIDIQREEFKRLGIIGDWQHPYQTMSATMKRRSFENWGSFWAMAECIAVSNRSTGASCVTALAEARWSTRSIVPPPSTWPFPCCPRWGTKFSALQGKQVAILIWTTTSWTLLANLAVAFHPDLEYVAAEVGEQVYIVAKDLAEAVLAKLHLSADRILAEFKGKELEHLKARHPFLDQESVLVLGEHVTPR